jgi:hypothetical protein
MPASGLSIQAAVASAFAVTVSRAITVALEILEAGTACPWIEQMRATRVGSAGRDGFVFDPNAGERFRIVEGSARIDDIDLATAATQSNIATDVDENAVGAGCFARLLDGAVDDVGLAESVNVDRTAGPSGRSERAPRVRRSQKS